MRASARGSEQGSREEADSVYLKKDREMKNLKEINTRKKWFLISIGLLLVFAIIGQIGIDKICLESERGQYWEYERCLPYMGITIAVTGAAIGLIYLAVRFFPVKQKILKISAWVLGIVIAGWMLFCSGVTVYRATDSSDVYGAAGLWIAYVDRLEEEQKVWDRSHWFGHGDEVYEYSYDEFTEAHSHLYLGNEEEEPYQSIVDERYRMEYVFEYCASDTMINVLSYFYGKWVWLLYSVIALFALILGASMLPQAGRLPGKLMFLAAWILFGTITLLPALNGCALVFDPVAGPLFTGIGWYYWQFGVLFTGPAIGVILGLIFRRKEKPPELTNTEEDSFAKMLGKTVLPTPDEVQTVEWVCV